MKILGSTALAMSVALAVTSAHAFQEQGGTPQAPAAPDKPAAGMSMPNQPIRGTGAEIRIPGLGSVGTLPKFDFGLELLYGAGEPKGTRDDLKQDPNDLQIRGTLKYRFPN
jgi:hypothetical protein